MIVSNILSYKQSAYQFVQIVLESDEMNFEKENFILAITRLLSFFF